MEKNNRRKGDINMNLQMKKVMTIIVVSLMFNLLLAQEDLKVIFPEGKSINDYRGLPLFKRTFDNWVESWRTQQVNDYIQYYHSDFYSTTSKQDFVAWQKHKQQIFNATRRVEVSFSDLTFKVIDENNLEITAYQEYQATRYNDFGRKKMMWKKESGQWKIVSEDWFLAERPLEPAEPPEEPPIVIIEPKPDPFKAKWEANSGNFPYEFVNFMLNIPYSLDKYLIVVEKKDQYAALYQMDENFRGKELLKTFFISSGQVEGNKEVRGDHKTPEGLYHTLRFIPEENLEAKFGSGAFVLDYPNELDRLRKKTGSGIWIHGSDIEMIPNDTEGCVRFENHEITYFHKELKLSRTPVIIAHEIEWVDQATLEREIEKIKRFLYEWEESWEQQNVDKYLSFYDHDDFISHRQKFNFENWAKHKRSIFKPRNPIRVDFIGHNYHYADNLLLVTFFQDYTAGSYNDFGRKQLVLRKDSSSWKIIQEEWVASKRIKNSEIGNFDKE